MRYTTWFDSPIGPLALTEEAGALVRLDFWKPETAAQQPKAETPLLQEAERQLKAYFAGQLRQFSVPLSPEGGTDFQRRVWQALQEIPYGRTRTYGELAAAIGCPKACRAVGMANHHNPIAIFIPCHRVIGANGSLTGYAGGLETKRWLLELEAAHCRQGGLLL